MYQEAQFQVSKGIHYLVALTTTQSKCSNLTYAHLCFSIQHTHIPSTLMRASSLDRASCPSGVVSTEKSPSSSSSPPRAVILERSTRTSNTSASLLWLCSSQSCCALRSYKRKKKKKKKWSAQCCVYLFISTPAQ